MREACDDVHMLGAGRVEAVCVVHRVEPGHWGLTAIDKRATMGAQRVEKLGLVADRQESPGHGGPDKAIYVYSGEDAAWWGERLQRPVAPGCFGENIRTLGLVVSDAVIGTQWKVGQTLLEVRMPRTPCENLSRHVGIDGFHREFAKAGRIGALCRVLEVGWVAADDPAEVVLEPEHGVTVAHVSLGLTSHQGWALLNAQLGLAAAVRGRATRAARRR